MPCQLVLDHRFPHQLRPSENAQFGTKYLARTIELFARCTWSPKIVNPIDEALDWTPEADFVTMYLDAVNWVLQGESSLDAYHEYSWRKKRVLIDVCDCMQDEPLSTYDAMLLMGALEENGRGESAYSKNEIDRLLADRQFVEDLQGNREVVVETYATREQAAMGEIEGGILKRQIDSEIWD